MKKIFIAFSFLLLLTSCGNKNEFTLTTDDLSSEIFSDIEVGNEKYVGESVVLIGVVTQFQLSDDNDDEMFVSLTGDVSCYINNYTENTVDALLYTKVKLTGIVSETYMTSSTIAITDCELIEIINTPEISVDSDDISSINFEDYVHDIIEIKGVVQLVSSSGITTIYLVSKDHPKIGLPIALIDPSLANGVAAGDSISVKVVVLNSPELPLGFYLSCFELAIEIE